MPTEPTPISSDLSSTPSPAASPPARTVALIVDDVGVTVRADLRLTGGATADVRNLIEATHADQYPDMVERALVIGLNTIASHAEVTETDAARMKLIESAERLDETAERLSREHGERNAGMVKLVEEAVGQLRKQITDGREEEQRLLTAVTRSAGELAKAAKNLNTNAGDLERKTAQAVADMVATQAAAKDSMLKDTAKALRKLVDQNDPTSAPALIKSIVDTAANDMRTASDKSVAGLEIKLKELLGDTSPLAEKVAKLAREEAERDNRRMVEELDKLRTELIVAKTREEHDPNVKGENYEDDVLELLTVAAGVYGLTAERTGTEEGDDIRSKKGDHLLLDESLERVAAVEARARKNVSARDLWKSMAATATNRGVKVVAYFVRCEEELPRGLDEFSRGRMPFTYKRLTDDVHAIVALIDPTSPGVAERMAVTMWLIDRLHKSSTKGADLDDAVARIESVLPCLEQLETRLKTFTVIKGGLTRIGQQSEQTREKVEQLEGLLKDDVRRMEQRLRLGNEAS
jgi:hypothetical protein